MGPQVGGAALRAPAEVGGVCGVARLSRPVYYSQASQRAELAERVC